MRLKLSATAANERLHSLVNDGYRLHAKLWEDYRIRSAQSIFDEMMLRRSHLEEIDCWVRHVVTELDAIFPTEREQYVFHHPENAMGAVMEPHYHWKCMAVNLMNLIRGLDRIRQNDISQYTDLPIRERLHVEDVDSFSKVRDVNPDMVKAFLEKGFLARSEDQVQIALEQILNVPFHRKDWGGEINDLYTANVIVNGARRVTAFLLKGPGIGRKEMEISDCGKRGDQVMRLFSTSAELYVVQYVGPIGDMLVKHVEEKVMIAKGSGKEIHYLIMDGQDTARLLLAYGKL